MQFELIDLWKFLQRKIGRRQIPYVIICLILGSLNHFLYEWSNGSAFVALFCPVNKSVWEHLKLIFFPFLFVSIAYYIKARPTILSFFYYRFIGVLSGMVFTIITFYSYTGVFGVEFLIVDLLIFVCAILISFMVAFYCCKHQCLELPSQVIIFSLWIIVACFFFVFTCFPPGIPLFFESF